jgi:hypothetical protein
MKTVIGLMLALGLILATAPAMLTQLNDTERALKASSL